MLTQILRSLFTAVLVSTILPFEAALTDELAATPLEGRWVGTGQQGEHTWPMEVTFGEAGARVHYPSLACGGQWEPHSSEPPPGVIGQFNEKLEYGHEGCVDDGMVRLTKAADGMRFDWSRSADSPIEATATLRRADPL